MSAPTTFLRRTILMGAALTALAPAAAQAASPADDVIVGVTPKAQAVGGERLAPRVKLVDGDRAERLEHQPGVRYVEPNGTFKVTATASTVPTDQLFSQQWALASADGIGAPGAWWTTRGQGAVIAVVDTGIDLSHPDLAPNVWTNPREVVNGRDDDGDGYVDDVHGANVLSGNGAVQDGFGHGTAMSGAAAAVSDRTGVTGVAPGAKIMPVKVLADDGSGNTSSVIEGIRYAVAHGADVINLSMNGPERSLALEETLAAAKAAGVVVVASAGNDAGNRDTAPSYPASAPGDRVLPVAAGSTDGGLAPFSGYGRSVPLAAPGQDVLSTARGGRYATSSGTSVATAQVSGAAALLAAARPGATPDQIRGALVGGVRRLRLDAGMVGSGGSLDASRAMSRLIPGAGPRVSLASRKLIRSRSGRVALRWRARGAVGAVARYQVRVGHRSFAVRSAAAVRKASQRRVLRLPAGRYRFTVAAYDASGRPLASRKGKVKVARKKKHRRASRHR